MNADYFFEKPPKNNLFRVFPRSSASHFRNCQVASRQTSLTDDAIISCRQIIIQSPRACLARKERLTSVVMKKTLSRRDFLKLLKKFVLSLTAVGASSFIYSVFGEPEWIEVSDVEIKLPRLPKPFDGFRILQLSDIHIGGWMNRKRLARVIELAKKEKPDFFSEFCSDR